METAAKGLLLVLVDPAPAMEEELNDWYDTEHLPERAAIPGFETALRFTSLGDGPRYAALYDLTGLDVLQSAAYRAVAYENFSPWTQRVTHRSRPTRLVARQMRAGNAITRPCTRLLLLKYSRAGSSDASEIEQGLHASFGSEPACLQYRVFEGVEPHSGFLLAVAEFCDNGIPPLRIEAFGSSGRRLELAAAYRPYRS
jgi:hypothetical protein